MQWLARGLGELGHEVVILAPPGSNVPDARIVPYTRPHPHSPNADLRPYLPPGIDVIHAHFSLAPAEDGPPTCWTLHGNARPGTSLTPGAIGVSADHARRHGLDQWVLNGLDPADYRFAAEKADYDLFLGRMHSAKGWQWAVEGARRAGRRLVVAGGWRSLFRRGVTTVGPVDGARKRELLSRAACLWMPAQWEEPFGLTVIEALVSGTPVLGTRRGALPELVSAQVGALGNTLEELVALRPTLARIDPHDCRDLVLQQFTHRIMAERYLDIYRSLLKGAHKTS